jgi:hypothetical protein
MARGWWMDCVVVLSSALPRRRTRRAGGDKRDTGTPNVLSIGSLLADESISRAVVHTEYIVSSTTQRRPNRLHWVKIDASCVPSQRRHGGVHGVALLPAALKGLEHLDIWIDLQLTWPLVVPYLHRPTVDLTCSVCTSSSNFGNYCLAVKDIRTSVPLVHLIWYIYEFPFWYLFVLTIIKLISAENL